MTDDLLAKLRDLVDENEDWPQLQIEIWRDDLMAIIDRALAAEAALAERDAKIESLRHHVKALQMMLKGQHAPMDFKAFEREVVAIDAALAAKDHPGL